MICGRVNYTAVSWCSTEIRHRGDELFEVCERSEIAYRKGLRMKTVIVYYSWTGKTELVAKAIAKSLNANVRKVEEVKKRKGFFGFISGGWSARKEQFSEIKPIDFNLGNYNLIFLGTPVWARRPTPAINAFISKADFRDKEVVLFATMSGVGAENTIKIMANRIETKGGKVINSFAIKTGGLEDGKIIKQGKDIGRQYRDE